MRRATSSPYATQRSIDNFAYDLVYEHGKEEVTLLDGHHQAVRGLTRTIGADRRKIEGLIERAAEEFGAELNLSASRIITEFDILSFRGTIWRAHAAANWEVGGKISMLDASVRYRRGQNYHYYDHLRASPVSGELVTLTLDDVTREPGVISTGEQQGMYGIRVNQSTPPGADLLCAVTLLAVQAEIQATFI